MPNLGSLTADLNIDGLGSAMVTSQASAWHYTPHAVRSAAAVTLNRMYCQPLRVLATKTFDRISLETVVAFAATGVARLGIYSNSGDSNDLPGALALDAGTIDDTVAPNRLDITISKQLTPGLYWLAFVQQTTATTGTVRHATWPGMAIPTTGTPEGSAPQVWPSQTSVSGALPDPFVLSGYTATCPLVFVRHT